MEKHNGLSNGFLVPLILLTVLLQRVASQANLKSSTLPLKSSLYGAYNQTLLSPSGSFKMGFWSATRSNSQSSTHTLAIWYAQLPPTTVVWMADRSLNLSSNASLLLSANGDLQLYDGAGVQSLWTSNTSNAALSVVPLSCGPGTLQLNVTEAVMLDTGNLILRNNTQHIVRQSFSYPTDTLLAGQTFSADQNWTMISWKTAEDWTAGLYSLYWSNGLLSAAWADPDPDLSFPPYWDDNVTESSSVTLTPAGQFEVANKTGSLTVIGESTESYVGSTTLLRRMTLDVDGNMRMYSWVLGSSTHWTVEWSALEDVCFISGICGPNAVCKSPGVCECPEAFKLVDDTDKSKGCERLLPIPDCNNSASVTMLPQFFVDYPYGDFVTESVLNSSYCIQLCVSSCLCLAAVVELQDRNGTYMCYLKKYALNGYFPGKFYNAVSYLKIGRPEVQQHISILVQALISVSVALGLLVIILGVITVPDFIRRVVTSLQIRQLAQKWGASRGTTARFTYKELQIVTRNFSEEIGKGGYGSVFKGEIPEGIEHDITLVAVKRLDKLSPAEKGFVNEVDTVGRIHHVNLVNLHGYCSEGKHRLLVYEYLERGSLDRALFRGDKQKVLLPPLEWRSRFNVAIDTAKGLAYLHEEVRDQCIIHCDVKPENILMDHMFTAKVADFGLSRILNKEQTRTMTEHIRGTSGYMAPEWTADHLFITTKTDVYSYGMVLLEIVSGRRNLKTSEVGADNPDWYFPLWAYPRVESGEFLEVVDPSLAGMVDAKQVERALQVAFWCIMEKPEMRPSMAIVVQMLQGHVAIPLPLPKLMFLETLMLREQQRKVSTQASNTEWLRIEQDEAIVSLSHSDSLQERGSMPELRDDVF